MNNKTFRFPLTCLIASVVSLFSIHAKAQQAQVFPEQQAQTEAPRPILKTYPIRYSTVDTIQSVMQTVFADRQSEMRLSGDVRTNSMIVYATADEHAHVAELLEALDVPEADQRQLRVFPMSEASVTESMQVLRMLGNDVDLAAANGLLIAKGEPRSIEELSQLLKMLHESEAQSSEVEKKGAPKDVTIEIICLTQSVGDDYVPYTGTLAVPLKKKGYEQVSELGTLQISSVVGGRAQASGALYSGQLSAEIEIDPTKSDEKLMISLDLDAQIDKQPVTFSTSINVPMNHWVVFGVAAPASDPDEQPGGGIFLMRVKPSEVIQVE